MEADRVAKKPSSEGNLIWLSRELLKVFNTALDYEKWFLEAFAKLEESPDNCSDAFKPGELILMKCRDEMGQLEIDLAYLKSQLRQSHQMRMERGLMLVIATKLQLITSTRRKKDYDMFISLYLPCAVALLPSGSIGHLLTMTLKRLQSGRWKRK